jgi:predicted nucleotidyltransferase
MPTFDPTTASRAVLMEVMNVLGAFRDDLVVVGGWVPDLLYPGRGHMGSLDVDVAISPGAVAGNAYRNVRARLTDAGYAHMTTPTRFTKHVEGIDDAVKVDLITGQYVEEHKADAIRVEELQINGLRGLDLAFEACQEIEISGLMPDGAQNTVLARIVQPEAFILIKAFALDERLKDKDAYDVAFVLRNFEPDLETLARRLRPLLTRGLANEGYGILKSRFASIDSVGPTMAARVYQTQGTDYEQARRAAFEDAQALFAATGSSECKT